MTNQEEIRTHWSEVSGGINAPTAYQRRFDDLAASGMDVHGEAAFVAGLVEPPARILDAGCGTGRVATQLTRLGYHCVGVDSDPAMIEVARDRDPDTEFVRQDITTLELRTMAFHLVVMAGNVVPLLPAGTIYPTLLRLIAHLQPGGIVVAGFGLDPEHLPPGCPVTPVESYERAASVAGLTAVSRYATWDKEPWSPTAGYVVDVHKRT